MELIDKSKLPFIQVRTTDNPEVIQTAVLTSDLDKVAVYNVFKTIGGREIPIEPIHTHSEHGKMDAEDAMIVASSIKGLSRTEQEAIEVLCDYYRNQNND